MCPSCHLVLASQRSPTAADLRTLPPDSWPAVLLSRRTSTWLRSAQLRDSQLSHPNALRCSFCNSLCTDRWQRREERLVCRDQGKDSSEPGRDRSFVIQDTAFHLIADSEVLPAGLLSCFTWQQTIQVASAGAIRASLVGYWTSVLDTSPAAWLTDSSQNPLIITNICLSNTSYTAWCLWNRCKFRLEQANANKVLERIPMVNKCTAAWLPSPPAKQHTRLPFTHES